MPEQLLRVLICFLTTALLAGGQETQESAEAAEPVVASTEPFDCAAGAENWQDGWSEPKKRYCCEKVNIGCEAPAAVPTTTTTTPAPAPPPPPPPPPPPVETPRILSAAELAAQEEAARKAAAERERLERQEKLHNELCAAVERGNKTLIDQALSKGALVNSTDAQGWSPLAILAISYSQEPWALDVAKHLILKGANVDQRDTRGRTPLYHASRYGGTDLVKEFLKTAKDLDTHDGDGVSAVVRAIWKGHGEIAKILYDAGANQKLAEHHGKNSEHQHIRRLFGGVVEEPVKPSSASAGKPSEL